ncbi:MAG: C25 family cysteine peptidase [Rubripirellula sp.]|nr:C25 family cysteine peptidase [Rubripirellula sp.]
MTRWSLLIVLLWSVLHADLAPADAADVIVVCPSRFRDALEPWVEHRQTEGLQVCVVDSNSNAETLRSSIRKSATDKTRYVMLVGDAPVIGAPCDELCQTPILYSPTTVTGKLGSTAVLSSDMLFGDFDLDNIPDAVVGRLPVDNSDQLATLIRRITARESSRDFGPWRGQIQLVGGVGGFGMVADRAIESVTRSIVTGVLPPETRTSVVYASPGHPFFPQETNFTEAVLNRYQRGSRFWVYAGHGRVTALDRVPNTLSGRPVLDQQTVQQLNRPAGESPIAVMLACYTGAMDAREDSLAEEMLLCDGGPIAVFAGSRVTMPYGNSTAAIGLIKGVFEQQLPRLGDAWLIALNQMQRDLPSDTSTTRMMIDALATIINPSGSSLKNERLEHMLLYNLLGDPTLRLNHPQPLKLQVPIGSPTGQPIRISLQSPIEGDLGLTLDHPLGATTDGDPNDTTVAFVNQPVTAGEQVELEVAIPEAFRGPLVIRAHVAGESSWSAGAAKTFVRSQ